MYLPDELVKLLSESYPECKSPGEVIATFILEVLAREIGKRKLEHIEELEAIAKAELIRRRLAGGEGSVRG